MLALDTDAGILDKSDLKVLRYALSWKLESHRYLKEIAAVRAMSISNDIKQCNDTVNQNLL